MFYECKKRVNWTILSVEIDAELVEEVGVDLLLLSFYHRLEVNRGLWVGCSFNFSNIKEGKFLLKKK